MAISSRRQYIQVSNAIRKHYPTDILNADYPKQKAIWDRFIEELVDTYSKDNFSFDADGFRKACVPNHAS
jgi:hypothetical protein